MRSSHVPSLAQPSVSTLGHGLVCFSVSTVDSPLLSVICAEEESSVTEEPSVEATVIVVGGSGGALTTSERAEVCLSGGDEAGSVDGPAGVSPSSGCSLLDVEEGSQPPPSSRFAVNATAVFGVSISFELSDFLGFLVPSRFGRVVSVVDRSTLDVGGGSGTARLAGARRGTGGATCSGAGEPVLEGGNGDEGRPDAGDPARERLNDIGEAADWGMGEPTRERGGEAVVGGVCGSGTVCGDSGRSEVFVVKVSS